jgi:hypothetical protein
MSQTHPRATLTTHPTQTTDPRHDAKVRVLIQAFRQHAHDAETLLIPELRRHLDPAERELLGRRLLERLGQLEGRPRPGW